MYIYFTLLVYGAPEDDPYDAAEDALEDLVNHLDLDYGSANVETDPDPVCLTKAPEAFWERLDTVRLEQTSKIHTLFQDASQHESIPQGDISLRRFLLEIETRYGTYYDPVIRDMTHACELLKGVFNDETVFYDSENDSTIVSTQKAVEAHLQRYLSRGETAFLVQVDCHI